VSGLISNRARTVNRTIARAAAEGPAIGVRRAASPSTAEWAALTTAPNTAKGDMADPYGPRKTMDAKAAPEHNPPLSHEATKPRSHEGIRA
jgi:hypothetical protein